MSIGPIVAQAAPVAQGLVDALTGDLVVIEGQFFRKLKRRVPTGKLTKAGRPQMRSFETLEPIDVSAHVNPLSLLLAGGVGVVGLGVGLWMLGLGVSVLTPENRAILEGHILGNQNARAGANLEQAAQQLLLTLSERNCRELGTDCHRIEPAREKVRALEAEIRAYDAEIQRLERRLRFPVELVTRPRFSIDIGV